VAGKDDVVVHLHTDPDDDAASTELYHYALAADVEALGLSSYVRFTKSFRMLPSAGLSADALAGIYAAADAHLLCSWGEGFGLPTLQAASAGVVPIAVAYSASRELVEGHGFAVPSESTLVDEFGLVRHLLDPVAAAEALETLYRDPAMLADMSARSREFALGYDWDGVVDAWEQVLRSAPPRAKPVRARSFDWRVGASEPRSDLPQPALEAASKAFAPLPEGATVAVRMAERPFGEAEAEIRRDAFIEGQLISIPVRMPPAVDGLPEARVGHVLSARSDLPVVAGLRKIFPGVEVSLPSPPDEPDSPHVLQLHELIPALPHYALVVDFAGECPKATDFACAVLGVPYAGRSPLWPPVPEGDPLRALRRLLTDQGLSESRRRTAAERAARAYGEGPIATVKQLALQGQPEPARTQPAPEHIPQVEMFLVRPVEWAPPEAAEQIAADVASRGGLILMSTGPRALVVALPTEDRAWIEGHPLVGFVGGITLDDEGRGARELKSVFARNVERQLRARQDDVASP
jgi:hypothetical protein